ncbi:MAG: alpha/beta hydrolase-fold protein [Bacteroidota bacterium]
MKRVFLLGISVALLWACQKEPNNLGSEEILSLSSAHTQQQYEIKVQLPVGYDPTQNYPVVYLLDGYYHYPDVQVAIDNDASLQDVILVGLFYEEYPFALSNLGPIEELREVDFTYPVHITQSGTELGGGGLAFYQFLAKELLPTIEDQYSADPNHRTIMGHSLGGYFVLFQLLEFRSIPLFQHVVALSPALWWSDLEILEMEKQVAEDQASLPFTLYLGIGTQEGVEANALVDELDAQISNHQHPALEYRMERYQGGHLHSAKTGFAAGLKFIFP